MPEDKDLKDAMHSDHIKLPKRDKSKAVWIVLTIVLLLALIGLGAYGYMRITKLNKSVSDQQATINDLQNKKKTLEDAAAAAATVGACEMGDDTGRASGIADRAFTLDFGDLITAVCACSAQSDGGDCDGGRDGAD